MEDLTEKKLKNTWFKYFFIVYFLSLLYNAVAIIVLLNISNDISFNDVFPLSGNAFFILLIIHLFLLNIYFTTITNNFNNLGGLKKKKLTTNVLLKRKNIRDLKILINFSIIFLFLSNPFFLWGYYRLGSFIISLILNIYLTIIFISVNDYFFKAKNTIKFI